MPFPWGAVAVANGPSPARSRADRKRKCPPRPPVRVGGTGAPGPDTRPPQARENAAAVGEAVGQQFSSGEVGPLSTRTDIQPESSDRARDSSRNRITEGMAVPVLRVPGGHRSSSVSEKELLL